MVPVALWLVTEHQNMPPPWVYLICAEILHNHRWAMRLVEQLTEEEEEEEKGGEGEGRRERGEEG